MAMRRSSVWERRLVRLLWERSGRPPLAIELWDGAVVGQVDAALGRLHFRHPSVIRALIWEPAIGLGDGYSDGQIDIEGDLVGLLVAIMQSQHLDSQPEWRRRPWWRWFRRQRGHSLQESQSSVYHHYDLGNDFYRLWLDEQLVYTCAYYERRNLSLEQAQIAKFDHVCRKLRLQPGDVVAEAGCGWGAFALHMARTYGAKVRAFNLSKEQLAYARARAQSEGLADRVEFIEDDYRHITGKYDVFVSIGMLEHVGVDQYDALGKTIDRVLASNGRGLIHTIGRNLARRLDAWTERRIFPGAQPPSLSQMMQIFEPHGMSVLDVENLRLHYLQTLRHWLERYEQHAESVRRLFDERFVRMWRFYLSASIAAFETAQLQLFQVLFTRAENNALPWTRADMYDAAREHSARVVLADPSARTGAPIAFAETT